MAQVLTLIHKPGTRRKARRIAGAKKHHEKLQERRRTIARERLARKRHLDTQGPVNGNDWDLDF